MIATPAHERLAIAWSEAFQDPELYALRYARTIYDHPVHGALVEPFPDEPNLKVFWQRYRDQDDHLVEKTRQEKISWACAIGFLCDIQSPYNTNWAGFIMSRHEKSVDDGGQNSTPQSLMGKIRFVYENLPEEMRAAFPLEFSFLRIRNVATGSVIVGASSSSQAGRGGHYDRALQDEDAFIPHSEAVFASIREACPRGIIKVTTPSPWGKGTCFYRLRQSPMSGFKVTRFHWSDNPAKACDCTSPIDTDPSKHKGCWYAKKCETMTPQQIAQELNISWEATASGRVYARFDPAIHTGHVPLIEGVPVIRSWDFGVAAQTAVIMAQVVQLHTVNGNLVPQIRIFDAYQNRNEPATHYREALQYRARGYNGNRVTDYGDPHSLTVRDSSLSSWRENLRNNQHPYKIHVLPSRCVGIPYDSVLDNSRKFLESVECAVGEEVRHVPRLIVDESLRELIEMFERWAYRTDDQGGVTAAKPDHNELSHYGDSFKYLCWVVEPSRARVTAPPSDFAKNTTADPKSEVFAGSRFTFSGGWDD